MARKKYDAEQLQKDFSDYDRHVEIVCCWHSWYENKVSDCRFDRFPHRTTSDGREVTPDFVVDFDNGYVLVGEVCLLPNNAEGFARSVAQAFGYADIAKLADVAVLLPFDIAAECELRIHEQGLMADDDPVVLVAYARNSGVVVNDRWEFARSAATRSARFRDDFLGPELSLGVRLCDRLKPLRIAIEYCVAYKRLHPFINDEPPAIYSAAFLWMKVIPLTLTKEDLIMRRLEDEDLSVTTDPEHLQALCNAELAINMRMDWIRSGLELLREAGLSKKQGSDYVIHLGKLKVSKSGFRDLVRQIAELVGTTATLDQIPSDQTVLELTRS